MEKIKMIEKDREQLLFNLKLDFAKVRITFENVRRLCTSFDYMGTPEKIVRVLFLSAEFRERLESSVRQVSFGSEESGLANSIIHAGVFDDAVVVFQEELPGATVWSHFRDYLCVEFVNPNGKLKPGDDDYVRYPGVHGYGSKGFNYFYFTIFDVDDDLIRELRREPSNWFILHCDDEHVCRYGGFSLDEFIKKTDRRNEIEIPIEIGRMRVCRKCGERFLFDQIVPEKLFERYRRSFGKNLKR